ncbi:HPr family phosphocarrier protein [Yoonia sp.]|uniref:HPr family phosphocarrier protein n=1 Tax=Yoonia sp. TaxID=2212373 RepID=UPI00233B5EBF|nr:HPr family phosphocarrier protein [Yoonia sp.]MDB4111231.1 HPr family phosphocarrier protein [Yoonia sp.]MDB4254920.1 HPr family phosphocarrier protein [bacterium]MDC1399032.1 HPr family phosphocarrier protein [Yoonia sp.]
MTKQRLKIQNIKGLHARASAKFVEVVESFDADAKVSKDGETTGGDSIMGLLMLAASIGTFIDVETSGPQADALAAAIENLVVDKFGEGD